MSNMCTEENNDTKANFEFLSGPLRTVESNDRHSLVGKVTIDLMLQWFSGCPSQQSVAYMHLIMVWYPRVRAIEPL